MKANALVFWLVVFEHNGVKYFAEKKRYRAGADVPTCGVDSATEDCLFKKEKDAKIFATAIEKTFGNSVVHQKVICLN